MSKRIAVQVCQRRLAVIWFLLSALVFAILIIQSMRGFYGEESEKAWSWFLPAVLPTLSLIVSAVAFGATQPTGKETANRFAYRIAASFSILYLFLVVFVLLAEPFLETSPLKLMETSNLWLGPMHGLVGISLGAFFVSREKR